MSTSLIPRRSRLPLLRQWFYKAAYLLVAAAIYWIVGGLWPTDLGRGILRAVLAFVLVFLATRVFRSAAELDDRPRPWWRMTGRPRAGFVLGTLSAIFALGSFADIIGVSANRQLRGALSLQPVAVALFLLFAALAVMYLTSSVQLRGILRAERIEAERGSGTGSSRAGAKH